ncbi:MAG: DHA2 family efflux MFS transporter permease subunit [Ktedonobacteraceae bacterium]
MKASDISLSSDMASQDQSSGDTHYKWKVMAAVIFGTFMAILDSTAVNVAVPTLQKAFHAQVDQVDAVLTAYILALGIITPLAGWLAERFGIKRIFLLAMGLFVAGSALCSLAPSLPWLVAFRALQGFGGGLLSPLGLALLLGAFSEKERGLAFGIYGIPLVVAPASGPVLGGYFVQYLSWHYIFLINIPIGIIGIVVGALFLRESKRGGAARLDIPGVLLSITAFGCLLFGIQNGQTAGWASAQILTLLSVGSAALIGFIVTELLVKEPLLDLRLFSRRMFASASVLGWVSAIALFGAEFLLPIYLQSLRGQTPLQAGLLVLPLAIGAGFTTPIAGALYNRIGGRWLIAFGSLLLAINTWQLSSLDLNTSYVVVMEIVAVRGIALGCVLQTTLTAALTGLMPEQFPRATSLLNASRNIFQSIGIAILGTIVTSQFTASQNSAVQSIHDPHSSLGQHFTQLMQSLLQHGVPASAVSKAAMGQVLGEIFNPNGPIFRVHFLQGLNDAYLVTFWLSIATMILAFTLPGRPKTRRPSYDS